MTSIQQRAELQRRIWQFERGILASTAEFRRDRNAMLRHMCGNSPQRTTCRKCMCRSYWSRMSSITSSRDQPITS